MNKYINKHTTILVILSIILLIQAVSAAQTKVIITFDDGWTSQYYTAFPIMQINNQEGTLFVVSNYANLGSGIQNEWEYMNISQLKALYSLNWDVSSHTLTHAHLTSINSTDLQNELHASMLWLNNNGFVKSSMFLAYPYGEYNNNVINAVKKNGYIAARTVDKNNGLYPQYTISSPDVLKMKTLVAYGIPGYGNNATPPDYIKNEMKLPIAAELRGIS